MKKSPYLLGASMYTPATNEVDTMVAIGNGVKYPNLRSSIFCTEDGIRQEDTHQAIRNLRQVLPQLEPRPDKLRFIRVRAPWVLGKVLALPCVGNIDGFVLPKINASNLDGYLEQLNGSEFFIMPTLETREVADDNEMKALRDKLCRESVKPRVLSIRIGGKDLLNCIGVRRCPRQTVYQTALAPVISKLVWSFKTYGFNLSAPVFEGLDTEHSDILAQETREDLAQGLFGKTAVHPYQIDIIEEQYKVTPDELERAEAVFAPGQRAAFKIHGTMCEPACEHNWANSIMARREIYGVRDEEEQSGAQLFSMTGDRRPVAAAALA